MVTIPLAICVGAAVSAFASVFLTKTKNYPFWLIVSMIGLGLHIITAIG